MNSRDAMASGGKLIIEAICVDLDAKSAKKIGCLAGPYVRLRTSDNGQGMDEKTREKIFDPFFTTKPYGQGTGLGLATVYGIIKRHGAWIQVESEVGKGTEFQMLFARVNEKAQPPAKKNQANEDFLGTETILMVEDEPILNKMNFISLSKLGYRVLRARHGAQAQQLGQQHDGEIHLLLTDVIMPHLNGKDLADSLTSQKTSMKVLFTSGYADDMIGHHGVLDEGVHFLPKPYTPLSLAQKVREVLDGDKEETTA
jgi:CheY-like chemotaxis protein